MSTSTFRIGVSMVAGAIVGVACYSAGDAMAGSVTYIGSSGDLEATATFDVVGGNLQITLTNSSSADVLEPSQVLTALFFDVDGSPTLTPVSGVLGAGSVVHFGPDNGGDIGGEWALEQGFGGGTYDQDYGVSSAGLGIFGADNRFGSENLQGPEAVDGLQYGLTSAGDNPLTGNAAVTGQFALIQNEVVLTISGIGAGFDPASAISNVGFQYGTSPGEPFIPGVIIPLPAPVLLGGAGLGLVVLLRRRLT